MSLRNLFSLPPDRFIAELKSQHPNFLSLDVANQLDKADPLGKTAEMFDIGRLIPFAGHSLGPSLKKSEEKILQTIKLQRKLHAGHFSDSHPEGKESGHWFDCDRHLPSLEGAQQLLGFKDMREFCFTASGLSQNLGMLVDTFFRPNKADWLAGKTKIVMLATEFFSDRAVVASIMKRAILTASDFGCFERGNKPGPEEQIIVIQPNKDGIYSTKQIIDVIASHASQIQMLCFPDIVFSTGQRLELNKIFEATGNIIEKNNIRVILDLAHTVGNRPINLSSMPVTAAVGCAYKHLSGPAGSSFGIYVNASVDLSLYPPIQGWKAADPSRVFESINRYDESIMENGGGAVAFRTSNPPPLPLVPAQAFLTVFGKIGFEKLFQKSERLTLYLIAQLQHHLGDKIDFITPLDPNQRGATICLRLKNETNLQQLEHNLKMSGYEIDTRPPNVIRMTAHYGYTQFSQICRFVNRFKLELDRKLAPTSLLGKLSAFANKLSDYTVSGSTPNPATSELLRSRL